MRSCNRVPFPLEELDRVGDCSLGFITKLRNAKHLTQIEFRGCDQVQPVGAFGKSNGFLGTEVSPRAVAFSRDELRLDRIQESAEHSGRRWQHSPATAAHCEASSNAPAYTASRRASLPSTARCARSLRALEVLALLAQSSLCGGKLSGEQLDVSPHRRRTGSPPWQTRALRMWLGFRDELAGELEASGLGDEPADVRDHGRSADVPDRRRRREAPCISRCRDDTDVGPQ